MEGNTSSPQIEEVPMQEKGFAYNILVRVASSPSAWEEDRWCLQLFFSCYMCN